MLHGVRKLTHIAGKRMGSPTESVGSGNSGLGAARSGGGEEGSLRSWRLRRPARFGGALIGRRRSSPPPSN